MSRGRPAVNAQIVDEAAEWFVTLRHDRAEAAVHEKFMTWLRISPAHVQAYLGVVGVWSDLPKVESLRDSDLQALIGRSRADENIVLLQNSQAADDVPASSASASPPVRSARFKYFRAAAAVFVLAGIVLALVQGNEIYRAGRYSTGLAEQRILRLPDGSKVELNSRSRIRVRYSDDERAVELLEGQALFDVAKDPRRPFLVRSDSAQMRALGTKFDVYRRLQGTTVTVVEGRVAIGAAAQNEIVLSAGEAVVVTAHAELRPVRTDVAAATAWTQGQLIFKSEPLSRVVEEFNRQNRQQIVLADTLEDFPVTAVFSSVDPRMLVEFLKSQPGLEARTSRDEIRIVTASQQGSPTPLSKKGAPDSLHSPL